MKKKIKDLVKGDVIETWLGDYDNTVTLIVHKIEPLGINQDSYKIIGNFVKGGLCEMYAPADEEVEVLKEGTK